MSATQILTPRYPCLAKAFHAQSLTSDSGCQGVRTNAWSLLALIKHWYKAFQHSLSPRGEAGSEGGGCRLCLERAESEKGHLDPLRSSGARLQPSTPRWASSGLRPPLPILPAAA